MDAAGVGDESPPPPAIARTTRTDEKRRGRTDHTHLRNMAPPSLFSTRRAGASAIKPGDAMGDGNVLLSPGAKIMAPGFPLTTDAAVPRLAGGGRPLDGSIGRTGHGCQGQTGLTWAPEGERPRRKRRRPSAPPSAPNSSGLRMTTPAFGAFEGCDGEKDRATGHGAGPRSAVLAYRHMRAGTGASSDEVVGAANGAHVSRRTICPPLSC